MGPFGLTFGYCRNDRVIGAMLGQNNTRYKRLPAWLSVTIVAKPADLQMRDLHHCNPC